MDKKIKIPSNDIVTILQIMSASFMMIFFIRLSKLHAEIVPKSGMEDVED